MMCGASAERAGRLDVFLLARRQRFAARDAAGHDPFLVGEREHDVGEPRAHHGHQADREHQVRESPAGYRPGARSRRRPSRADSRRRGRATMPTTVASTTTDDADEDRNARAVDDAREHVAARARRSRADRPSRRPSARPAAAGGAAGRCRRDRAARAAARTPPSARTASRPARRRLRSGWQEHAARGAEPAAASVGRPGRALTAAPAD